MTARKAKPPTNVVSLADYRRRHGAVAPSDPDPRLMQKARVIAEFATSIGVDLRLVAAIQRGDIPPVA